MYSTTTTMQQERIAPSSYLSRMFTIVQHDPMRFLIMDCPTDNNLVHVMKMLSREGVTDVVRVCEPTYAKDSLTDRGIFVHDLAFSDGGCPPNHVVQAFLSLVQLRFFSPTSNGGTIAVHCVAGLGRAPVMIAIALIEAGMLPLDAIEYVRARRRGAFNTTQVKFLDAYKPVSNRFNPMLLKRTSSPRLLSSLNQYKRSSRPRPADVAVDAAGVPVVHHQHTSFNWAHKFSRMLTPFSMAFSSSAKQRAASSSLLSKAPADVAAHP